ncbi:PREDICTED: HIPL2 protein-like [Camelina sativa]|nr:PREDICTED: HIPL2 protein-like [Camelina sativa]
MGVRNPWRCSFDSERPSYFLCADVGEDKYEEVDMITKGGNYGWHYYEGTLPFNPSTSSKISNSTAKIANPIFPVMWYNHSEGSASVTGGYFYRSSTDPCLYGTYLFADLYAGVIYGGTETPVGSGNFTSSHIPLQCASDSPIPCSSETESSATSPPLLGFVFSFGQDNNKDVYLLASTGIYRIVRPSRCNLHCSLENTTSLPPSQQPDRSPPSPSSSKRLLNNICTLVINFLANWYFILVVM